MTPYSRHPPRDQNASLLHKKWYPPTENHPLLSEVTLLQNSDRKVCVLLTLSTPHRARDLDYWHVVMTQPHTHVLHY